MSHTSTNTKAFQVSVFLKQYWQDESGSTAIEYGLIAALISVLLVTGGSALGGSVNIKFAEISKVLSSPPEAIEGANTNSVKP